MRERFRIWWTAEVRWGDMDAFGHVNNAKYFTYCESARIRYFEETGCLDRYERDRHGPAVVSAMCDFRQQVRYPETLDVGVRVERIGRTSFVLGYGLFRQGTEDLVADGSSVAVWVDYNTDQAIPVPEEIRQRMREMDPDLEEGPRDQASSP